MGEYFEKQQIISQDGENLTNVGTDQKIGYL